MSPRPYNLGLRLVATEQTRSRIIAAARELLSDDDFTGLSIEAIARQAGVARMTIYHQFGSRRGLLEALYDDIAARGLAQNLIDFEDESDPVQTLQQLITVFSHFWASDHLVIRRLRGLAVIDPEIEVGLAEREDRRSEYIATLLSRIEELHGWQSTHSREDLTDLLDSLCSFDTYDVLANGTRDAEQCSRLLQRAAMTLLNLPA